MGGKHFNPKLQAALEQLDLMREQLKQNTIIYRARNDRFQDILIHQLKVDPIDTFRTLLARESGEERVQRFLKGER